MAKVLIAGGGLAGLAAAAALGRDGWEVDLYEARPFLGGRATSYAVPAGGEEVPETIDNCQHVLLRCCVNLLDFYQRLGVRERIRFFREFYFIEPGGRISVLKRGRLPAPFHFTGAFLGMKCFSRADKVGIARALLALRRERTRRKDLDRISMLDWLLQKRQTPHAIDRFWRQVLVSAINEDLDRMAAVHGFQVFWLGFLSTADGYEMGIPERPARGTVHRRCLAQHAERAHALPRPGGTHRRERFPDRRPTGYGRSVYLRAALREAGIRRIAGADSAAFTNYRCASVV